MPLPKFKQWRRLLTNFWMSKQENIARLTDLGVDYIHMTKRGDIDKKLENIKKTMGDAVTVDNENSRSGYSETYYYFLIPLIAILIFDLIYYKRKI